MDTAVQALRQAIYYLDRELAPSQKVRAFLRAIDVVEGLPAGEIEARVAAGTLTELDGIGKSTGSVIAAAVTGERNTYLDDLAERSVIPLDEGAELRAAIKGDCHAHSTWSDGGATIREMAEAAQALGHEYLCMTDHSPRLTIAHGLSEERLARQLDEIEALNAELEPFRILTGLEVDILVDGSLDLSEEMLARLDLVVASVHSKFRLPADEMTRRMVMAIASPHVDILGHCTGRMIGKRPESEFDADYVFAACAQFGTAVELNCRPERLDPPRELIDLAIEYGCYFSIDSDAHATGQLEWQPYGCNRAAERNVPIDRIINTWSADELLAWTSG